MTADDVGAGTPNAASTKTLCRGIFCAMVRFSLSRRSIERLECPPRFAPRSYAGIRKPVADCLPRPHPATQYQPPELTSGRLGLYLLIGITHQ